MTTFELGSKKRGGENKRDFETQKRLFLENIYGHTDQTASFKTHKSPPPQKKAKHMCAKKPAVAFKQKIPATQPLLIKTLQLKS